MILGIVIVFAVGGRMILSVLNPPNDLALIKTALADSIKATKEGRPGGVMDKLSVNLKFNGESESGNRNEIARYIRNSRPEVTVEQIEPVVTGDEARIVSPVDLKIGLLGVNKEAHLKEVKKRIMNGFFSHLKNGKLPKFRFQMTLLPICFNPETGFFM